MNTIHTLVVEDEPLARKRLTRQLSLHTDIHLVGEAANGREGLDQILKLKPDLIFLDVQMPDLDGFAMLDQLQELGRTAPFVIFVTAYDRYALKAFDVHAVDYLLKPYDNDRLCEALDLARRHMLLHNHAFQEKLNALMHDYRAQDTEALTHFKLKKAGRILKIPVEEVVFLEASGNYLTLHLCNREELYRGTMNAVQRKLDPSHFLRIHRGYLINAARVTKARYLNNNEYQFHMETGRVLVSGRSFKGKILTFLSETDLI